MSMIFLYGAVAAMAAVLLTLLVGVFAMGKGGAFNRRYGQTLMRLRVALQALAVTLLILAVMVDH